MSLMFLKRSKDGGIASSLMARRKPEGGIEAPSEEAPAEDANESLHSASADLLAAFHAKDVKAISAALKAAFQICDSEPHSEGEHVNPHSYDAQNAKAASNE
jgi:hypothetical protein